MRHLHFGLNINRRRGFVISSAIATIAAGVGISAATAATAGTIGAAVAYGVGGAMIIGKQQSNAAKKQMNAYMDQQKQLSAPDPSQIADNAANTIDSRRRSGTQTVYTNPLGLTDSANVVKKSLLGQ
jgi:hypothetical protein